jgi:hypothetical protein
MFRKRSGLRSLGLLPQISALAGDQAPDPPRSGPETGSKPRCRGEPGSSHPTPASRPEGSSVRKLWRRARSARRNNKHTQSKGETSGRLVGHFVVEGVMSRRHPQRHLSRQNVGVLTAVLREPEAIGHPCRAVCGQSPGRWSNAPLGEGRRAAVSSGPVFHSHAPVAPGCTKKEAEEIGGRIVRC